jgi:hypothetical protein
MVDYWVNYDSRGSPNCKFTRYKNEIPETWTLLTPYMEFILHLTENKLLHYEDQTANVA